MTTPSSDQKAAQVRGAVIGGRRAELIQVRAAIGAGPPAFTVTSGYGTSQTRDRIRAAVINSGAPWPAGAITVSPDPARTFGLGCGADLPVAVAILGAAGVLPRDAGREYVFAAELGLDGRLRPVRDLVFVLNAVAEAGGPVTTVIAPGNCEDACTVPGVPIVFCQSLRQVLAWLRGQQLPGEGPVR